MRSHGVNGYLQRSELDAAEWTDEDSASCVDGLVGCDILSIPVFHEDGHMRFIALEDALTEVGWKTEATTQRHST